MIMIKRISVFLFLVFPVTLLGVEQTNLTVPHVGDPRQTTVFRVEAIAFDWSRKYIMIRVGNGVLSKTVTYTGDTARVLMNQLNTANLSANSLHRRIMQRLINDGHFSGSISGTPDP